METTKEWLTRPMSYFGAIDLSLTKKSWGHYCMEIG